MIVFFSSFNCFLSSSILFSRSNIGKEAKTIQPTDKENGRITIYGEDWIARSVDGNEIPKDTIVKIISYENSIFFVEKI